MTAKRSALHAAGAGAGSAEGHAPKRWRRRLVRLMPALLFALVATLASLAIPGRVHQAHPGSLDCDRGCDFVAAGWPLPYLVDGHGLSPTGSVSLLGGLLGIDQFRYDRLAVTALFWLGLGIAADRVWRRRRRTGPGSLATRDTP